MRLVAQPLDEIENRIARTQPERLAPRHEEGLAPGIALRPLGNADQRKISDAKCAQCLARRGELALPAIDQYEVGPGGVRFAIVLFDLHGLAAPLPHGERVPER